MNRLLRYTALTLLPAALTACSGHDDAPDAPADAGYILFGGGERGSVAWEASSMSRGGAPVQGVTPESVGVFGYNNFSGGQSYQGGGEVFNNVQLYWREGELFKTSGITSWLTNPDTGHGLDTDGADNLWPYTPPMPWLCEGSGVSYKFFAYTPYTPYGTDIEVFGRSYESFESVEWHHVPRYSADDYMLADRIVEYTSRPTGNDLQIINMQHLQARLRFCFKLGPEFSKLRMVRVKKVEIVGQSGFRYTLRARYTAKTEGLETVLRPSMAWTVEDGMDDTDITLANEPDALTGQPVDYIELSRDVTEYLPLASLYAYPNVDIEGIQIRVTYDVYDYYPEAGLEPALLRSDDQATNTVNVNLRSATSTSGTATKLQAGYYYDVRIMVEPSYLYVLSDHDFDAEGYLIISDE